MKRKNREEIGLFPTQRWKKFIAGAINTLFYSECSHCGNPLKEIVGKGLCRDCWNTISRIEPPQCVLCGVPFQENFIKQHIPHRCSACIETPPDYDFVRSHGTYTGKLKDGIHSFKYAGNKAAGDELAQLLLDTFSRYPKFRGIDFITSVPLHYKRKRKRGFNQASILSKGLSSRTGLSFKNILKREKNTRPQTELTEAQRKKNVRGAFCVRNERDLTGNTVLLIDDVFTTGSTLRECSKELKRAGTDKILALTAARVT